MTEPDAAVTSDHPADPRLAQALIDATAGRFGNTRSKLRALGDEAPRPPRTALGVEAYRDWTDEAMQWVAGTGVPALGFPPEMGGTGDYGAAVTGFEMLGHGDLSLTVKAGVHWGLFGGAVANLGTERHHHLGRAIIDGSLPGCFAMTETGHGSDVQSLLTTATYDPATDELVVHSPSPAARKDYIGGAARSARMAAVFAQLVVDGESEGVHCVLVPIRDENGDPMPGVTIGDCGAKGGLTGVDNGRLMFDEVRVPRTNLLGRYGDIDDQGRYHSPIESRGRRFFTMLGTLVRGRISVAGGANAASRSALEIATKYAEQRTQFTAPGTDTEIALLDYRTHQRKLLPRIATAYALILAQNDLVSMMHDVQSATGLDEAAQRELETMAAGIKAYATDFATETIQVCREACGGAGYLTANRLVVLRADTDVFTTFEGDNTVLLQLVAKSLLTNFQRSFGAMDTIEMVRFGSRTVADQVVERTSVRGLVQRFRDVWSDALPFTDRLEQVRLFTDRETHMLEGLARRLRRAGDPGEDAFAIANSAQDHLVATAVAHVERNVLESFIAGIEGAADADARHLLERLCDLFALSTLEKHRAWYLEHDRLTPDRSKALTATVNQLCAELRPQARTLVEGFGIPNRWLATEMMGAEAV
ncbi:acyl-CoA dehydrogenase family protein [Enemella evansiae]|uniref:acyl-CoA dehydrogenase family protein n=1 Tax=Enemella evansiae TaxID=2016499 RepID=UPI000B9734EC|nr:acyl-CoA dehydrogenase [Enemella evansiae]OYO04131.1 acyl-CoA oxidase [Enemella evansiae]